ncbi:MAG: hypothetical protein H7124_10475 [Phycisphaerales bacterium]|nr:hypothetical protein [Hyphomonadaceae bacterium]
MRKVLLMLAAAAILSGCMSTLQGAYDDRRQQECEEENRRSGRLDC